MNHVEALRDIIKSMKQIKTNDPGKWQAWAFGLEVIADDIDSKITYETRVQRWERQLKALFTTKFQK